MNVVPIPRRHALGAELASFVRHLKARTTSTSSLRAYIRRGQLRLIKVGKTWLVTDAALARLRRSHDGWARPPKVS